MELLVGALVRAPGAAVATAAFSFGVGTSNMVTSWKRWLWADNGVFRVASGWKLNLPIWAQDAASQRIAGFAFRECVKYIVGLLGGLV